MPRPVPVALIGQQFMGRAHSNAYSQAARFFDLPREPVRHTICGRDEASLKAFAERWGWAHTTTRWQDLAEDDAIELVDVSTPNDLHRAPAIRMLEAGKHVACEKPLAGTLDDARAMRDAARKSKARTFVWFNYRRCPAVAHAFGLMRKKKLGRVFHVRAHYLQSWGGPETPMAWRFRKKRAGSGAHGDLNAHSVDLARFLMGEEIAEVHGAVARTFVKERRDAVTGKQAKSDVDDCVLFNASFQSGATASFEASRLATGHLNRNFIEINGEKGALRFDFENMNVLWVCDDEPGPESNGWRRVMCTSGEHHPYVGNWWPDAHLIGYEHGFANMVADMMRALAGKKPAVPLPDFEDAYQTQRVLEAALVAARERRSVKLSTIR